MKKESRYWRRRALRSGATANMDQTSPADRSPSLDRRFSLLKLDRPGYLASRHAAWLHPGFSGSFESSLGMRTKKAGWLYTVCRERLHREADTASMPSRPLPLLLNRARYVSPLLSSLFSDRKAEYTHLKDSIMSFPSVEEWISLMGEAGELDRSGWDGMGCWDGVLGWWGRQAMRQSSCARRVSSWLIHGLCERCRSESPPLSAGPFCPLLVAIVSLMRPGRK